MKIYKVITAALAALAMSVIGCVCAGAYSVQPILANENKTTVWIFFRGHRCSCSDWRSCLLFHLKQKEISSTRGAVGDCPVFFI